MPFSTPALDLMQDLGVRSHWMIGAGPRTWLLMNSQTTSSLQSAGCARTLRKMSLTIPGENMQTYSEYALGKVRRSGEPPSLRLDITQLAVKGVSTATLMRVSDKAKSISSCQQTWKPDHP
jgi:hypothetical protein